MSASGRCCRKRPRTGCRIRIRNNRIGANGLLNRRCVLAPDVESILRGRMITDWTDPAHSAAFLILKWPMKVQDTRQREKDPRDPWKHLPDSVLRSGTAAGAK